jgi:hypothetical protein
MISAFKHRPELDGYEFETRNLVSKGKCEGSCEEHFGVVRAVRVVDSKDGFDWGWFSYCEAAREADISRGFLLFEQTPQ